MKLLVDENLAPELATQLTDLFPGSRFASRNSIPTASAVCFCSSNSRPLEPRLSIAITIDRSPKPPSRLRTAAFSRAAVNDGHFRAARQLLANYGVVEALRTLDALQLAVALGLKRTGLVSVFVAADQKLCRVATLEGFAVTSPGQPASIVI